MLTLDKIYHAAYVLQNVIRRTDLISAPKINPESNIYLKPENLQLTGSFKIRGSYYKISQLSDAEKAKAQAELESDNFFLDKYRGKNVTKPQLKLGIASSTAYAEATEEEINEATDRI